MKKLFFLMCALVFMSITSCKSESDKIEGTWNGSSSIMDNFVKDRTFQNNDTRKAYINTLSFSKDSKNSGTFTSTITPVMTLAEKEAGNPIFIGSELSGSWEIKDKKLYMKFGSAEDIELLGSNNLNQTQKEYLKAQIFENSWKYIAPAMDGMEYSITKDGKTNKLKIYFGNQLVEFYKKEN